MREARARDVKMRRIRMVDRRQHAALAEDRLGVDRRAEAHLAHQRHQPDAATRRRHCQRIDAGRALYFMRDAIVDDADSAAAIGAGELDQAHVALLGFGRQ